MTPQQAANALGLSLFAIWKAIKRGRLVAIGEPGSYTLATSEVERYRRENLGRRGPVTTRCLVCGHSYLEHMKEREEGQCGLCGDEYTPDPRLDSV